MIDEVYNIWVRSFGECQRAVLITQYFRVNLDRDRDRYRHVKKVCEESMVSFMTSAIMYKSDSRQLKTRKKDQDPKLKRFKNETKT
jgi:hypothetical protein